MASTNLQVDAWCRPRAKAWLGVHSSDLLPDLGHLPPRPGGCTCISDTSSSTHDGVHWITLGGLLDTTAAPCYFSAFGDRPDDCDALHGTHTRFAEHLAAASRRSGHGGTRRHSPLELECHSQQNCGQWASFAAVHGLPQDARGPWQPEWAHVAAVATASPCSAGDRLMRRLILRLILACSPVRRRQSRPLC